MSNWLNDLLDRAEADGLFDDLPGAGKPLHLHENPYEDPSDRVANRMLRNSGYTLPWIEDRQRLLADIEALRVGLKRAWSGDANAALWRQSLEALDRQLVELNQRIRDFNLKAPTVHVHLSPLNRDREVARATKD